MYYNYTVINLWFIIISVIFIIIYDIIIFVTNLVLIREGIIADLDDHLTLEVDEIGSSIFSITTRNIKYSSFYFYNKYNTNGDDNIECSICYDDINFAMNCTLIACGHLFHRNV